MPDALASLSSFPRKRESRGSPTRSSQQDDENSVGEPFRHDARRATPGMEDFRFCSLPLPGERVRD
jgi:hypothetical protein